MGDLLRFATITVLYAGMSGYGLFLIKATDFAVSLKLVIGISLYGLGFVVWLWMLKAYELSIAFPVAAGSLIIATQLFGLLLGEGLGWLKIGGVLLIIIGTVVLSLESR